MTNQNTMRIGADVGGTFTDVVLMDASGNLGPIKSLPHHLTLSKQY